MQQVLSAIFEDPSTTDMQPLQLAGCCSCVSGERASPPTWSPRSRAARCATPASGGCWTSAGLPACQPLQVNVLGGA